MTTMKESVMARGTMGTHPSTLSTAGPAGLEDGAAGGHGSTAARRNTLDVTVGVTGSR